MRDKDKTKEQLIEDLKDLRQRIAGVSISEADCELDEEALRGSDARYRELVERIDDVIYAVDDKGVLTYVSPAIESFAGYAPSEVIGRRFEEFIFEEDHQRVRESYLEVVSGHGSGAGEYRVLTKSGELRWMRTSSRPMFADGRVAGVQGVLSDITDLKRAEEALRESEKRYRTLFQDTRDAMNITTRDGQVLDANQSFLELFGYTREDLAGLNAKELYVDPVDRRRFQEEIERKGSVRDYEVRLRKKDGTEMDCLVTSTVRQGENGRVLGYQGFIHDVTERKQVEETIRRLAYYDALTGLPNRTLFGDRLTVAVARARRNRRRLAVMLLDLDHFKDVNDSLGHPVGDQLLQAVGEGLTGLLRRSDTVCRMGGDEFLVLLEGISEMDDVAKVADAILKRLREPVVVKTHELKVTTSLGIAVYPEDGEDGDTLIRNADIAMYRAKDKGRDNYQRYVATEEGESTSSQ
ncbi:MAG: PAS domain S-box protein [Anaerolineae bacterium]|nr:PAS domain S-box protein [Anaerolineae bacterium]NIN94131.1 PAS domain S-box protein [Anaerolineae bacterium]NIQ77178.1 PAS domain S-box protein [Anaerolineae bacterium]